MALSMGLKRVPKLVCTFCGQLKKGYSPWQSGFKMGSLFQTELSTLRTFSGCILKPIESFGIKKNEMYNRTKAYPWDVNSFRTISKKNYEFPEILESDLEEQFVRGSGPGGQSVNKTSNCVVLKHLPTALHVKCHDTRSLEENRKIARQRLRELLDVHLNQEQSYQEQKKKHDSLAKKTKKSRTNKKLELKRAFKEREGLD